MGDLQIFIAALFVSAAGLNALANWLRVPYPIPLVIGGLLLGLAVIRLSRGSAACVAG